jgi:hypothetical protein
MLRKPALLAALLATAAAAQTRPPWDGAFTAAEAGRGRAPSCFVGRVGKPADCFVGQPILANAAYFFVRRTAVDHFNWRPSSWEITRRPYGWRNREPVQLHVGSILT